jgi:hypothetical protein
MFKKIVNLPNLTLLVALSLSTVAAYYSIIGLTAIFAGAVIPVIIMGSMLEVAKITTTVWLRKYWNKCSWVLKLYLVPAVVALALLTSMGIFGFLSKAHMDQGITSGDVQAKLSLYDEKIKTQRDNIELARKALQQMDAQVDQRLSRSDSEQAAERAVQIRRQQAGERTKLQKEIGEAQKEIQKLNEERAPIAAENRKVEAEVGPVKYIAALIYGDNADTNMLEAAVRWVIILLVVVFDPLAIALVLAGNQSKEWLLENTEDDKESENSVTDKLIARGIDADEEERLVREANEKIAEIEPEVNEPIINVPMKFVDLGEHPKDHDEKSLEEPIIEEQLPEPDVVVKEQEKSILEQHPYLTTGFSHFQNLEPMVYKPETEPESLEEDVAVVNEETVPEEIVDEEPKVEILAVGIDPVERPGDYLTADSTEIMTEGVTQENPITLLESGYVMYDGKQMTREVMKDMHPELFRLRPDLGRKVDTNFGSKFPEYAQKGDVFVRVDALPNRVYKFDGKRWIEVNKDRSDSYLHDQKYIEYLVEMIDKGEYDVELLSDHERDQISEFLNKKKH